MVIPDSTALECFIGFTWAQEFIYWDDTANTVPHSFSGETVTFTIEHQNGTTTAATVDISGNSVVCSLTSSQTAAMRAEAAKYTIAMAGAGERDPLGAGRFFIRAL